MINIHKKLFQIIKHHKSTLPAFALISLNLPQIPLLMSNAVHPQTLIAVANSQSMDGDLGGAIMVGSGILSPTLSTLYNTSSPQTYSVPDGFTPPLQAADSNGLAPYTFSKSSISYDNSASRLNVAKSGILAILQAYLQTSDFGLEVYNTSNPAVYNTWVYYISPTNSNFVFTNTKVSGNTYVNNPCYNYSSSSSAVKSNCGSIASLFGTTTLSNSAYMQIGASSDSPSINDVLYATSSFPGIFVTYSGPTPATPYPPNFSITNYNNSAVSVSYSQSSPNVGGFSTSPTNAGYVPYSKQVMYVQRGFGYYGSQSANTGTIAVPMTSAGTNPTASSIATATATFSPYLQPETNSSSTKEIKSIGTQSPTAALLVTAKSYFSTLGTTSGNGCPQKKYLILISDGLPTEDLNGKFWPPLGSAAATGYNVTATFNANGGLASTNCQALSDTISSIRSLYQAGIPTYVIGMGAGVNPNLNAQAANTLTAMAVAGNTVDYYPATDPQSMVDDLNSIMVTIQNGTYTTTAASVNSTQLNSGSIEYISSYNSSDSPYQDWTGNLVAIPLNTVTGAPTGVKSWSAQSLLDNLVNGTGWSSNRFLVTWNPTINDGVPFQWANLSSSQQLQLQPLLDTQGAKRVQYLRGNTALEQRNGGTFRNRSHILGDIVDSQVLYVGKPSSTYTSASYVAYSTAQASRKPMLYVGANDGILHAFDATSGKEVFGFIPNGVFSNLINLTSTSYNMSHLFYVDGSPQAGDVQFSDGSWHTLLVSGENAGGSSIFTLDVTNPQTVSPESTLAQKVLWEFTDADMGSSFSQPEIAAIGSASASPLNFATFFGNGYNSSSNTAVLYALNPQTGAVIRKINLCTAVPSACNAALPQGLSSVTLANQSGFQSQPITNVYAGDLQGNLWSINVSDSSATNWTVKLLFKATDSLGIVQPITTPPVVTLNPNYPRVPGLLVMFGTGKFLETSDLLTTQTQTIYGVLDSPSNTTSYKRANLQSQTLTNVSTTTSGLTVPIITASTNTINWRTQVGWYADLPSTGQRVVTAPTIYNGAFIVTLNTPPLQLCGGSYSSTLLELNYANGGALPNQQFGGANNDGTISNAYKYTNLAGIQLSSSFANSPTLVGPNQANNMALLITQSNGQQSTILNPNNTPRKVGWWQLQ